MKCLFFHDWEKWVNIDEISLVLEFNKYKKEDYAIGVRVEQTRACKKCGTVQLRIENVTA